MKVTVGHAIAAFLEAQAKGETGAGKPGEKLVKQRCTGCHRLDGKMDESGSDDWNATTEPLEQGEAVAVIARDQRRAGSPSRRSGSP